jgi:hypothetical protein
MLVAKEFDSLQCSSLNGINQTISNHLNFYGIPLRAERMLRDYHLNPASWNSFFTIFHPIVPRRLRVMKQT